jgi:hypothetical protein
MLEPPGESARVEDGPKIRGLSALYLVTTTPVEKSSTYKFPSREFTNMMSSNEEGLDFKVTNKGSPSIPPSQINCHRNTIVYKNFKKIKINSN